MCNFCNNCGSDLRKQEPTELPFESAFVEIGEYNHEDLRYQIEGDAPLFHCSECGSITMDVPTSLDELIQAASSPP